MFCSKCGQAVAETDKVCSACGNALNEATTPHNKPAKTKNTALILLAIGVGIAALICIISIVEYGRIYFFDGYDITKFAWIAAIGCALSGLIAFVKDIICLGISTLFVNGKGRFFAAILLICVIPGIFLYSYSSKTNRSYDTNYDYLDDPNYYQNTFESCHSTYEHKQALYSYDINNDNYLSEYELELFAKAHPRFVQDKAFVAWVESMMD